MADVADMIYRRYLEELAKRKPRDPYAAQADLLHRWHLVDRAKP